MENIESTDEEPDFTGIKLKAGAPPADQLRLRYSLTYIATPSVDDYLLRNSEGDAIGKPPSAATIAEMASLDWAWCQEGAYDLVEVMASSPQSKVKVEIVDLEGMVWSEEFDLKPYMHKEMTDADLLSAIRKGIEES